MDPRWLRLSATRVKLLVYLLVMIELVAGCINVTVTAPEAAVSPATSSNPTAEYVPNPDATLEIIEKEEGEEIIPEPELYQYEITIKGKVIDNVTRKEVKNAKAIFITETGTHIFNNHYKFTVPSGSVLRFIITAPGYEKVDKLFKPRLLRNATIDMDITIGKAKGPIG